MYFYFEKNKVTYVSNFSIKIKCVTQMSIFRSKTMLVFGITLLCTRLVQRSVMPKTIVNYNIINYIKNKNIVKI